MADPIWITVAMVKVIHADQVATHGGTRGLRDEGLLASALARARNRYAYEGADIYQLAAAYGFGIAKNHLVISAQRFR